MGLSCNVGILDTNMVEARRIRKRGEKKQDYLESLSQEQQQEIITKQDPTEEESDNFITRAQSRKQQEKLQIKQAIDEMNADITDERRLELDEIVEEGLERWGSVGGLLVFPESILVIHKISKTSANLRRFLAN